MQRFHTLAAMTAYPQFILWTTTERDGRLIKLPIHPLSFSVCDPHDPSSWVDLQTAVTSVSLAGPNYGIGFVFTNKDPFFFFDIDHCKDVSGQWSEQAVNFCNMFPNAAKEISQSGEGIHIFGMYAGQAPAHSCKNTSYGIELYTHGRYAALTGNNATGDIFVDYTEQLQQLINWYFPPQSDQTDVPWTNQPDPSWTPIDDLDIIAKARKQTNAKAAFGLAATFDQLWTKDITALATAYPSQNDTSPYDESSADAALAAHLAFWCGKNCEHVKTLMFQSALVRDKWKRTDYLVRTISRAVANQRNVYGSSNKNQTPVYQQPVQQIQQQQPGEAQITAGAQILTVQQQLNFFQGCVYVNDLNKIFTMAEGGMFLNKEQFRVRFGGYAFVTEPDGSKTTKNAWEAFTESQCIRWPMVSGICFRPELPPGAIVTEESRTLLNTYVPIETPSVQGNVSPFLNHLTAMLPDERDREILLSYMAACVQYPGIKFQWAPLLQGCEGNGKTLFVTCVAQAVGNRYTHLPNASELGGSGNKFNSWIQNKLFIGVEEIHVGNKREIADALKPLITNSRIEIQAKGANQFTGDNRANFILCSNHKDAVLKTASDRRYCVLFTAQQSIEDMDRIGWRNTNYFPQLYGWLKSGGYACVTHFLKTYQIKDQYNPATVCHRAPDTTSTGEAIMESLGRVEQEILEAVDAGKYGFANGWISSMAMDRLLKEERLSGKAPLKKRRGILQTLGYDYHPGLEDGRTNSIIPNDGGKPRLYIKKGHLAAQIRGHKEIVAAYVKAQNETSEANGMAQMVFGG